MFAEWHHLLKTYHTPIKTNISIKTYNLCSIENLCFLIYLTMDNKIQTTAININLCNHHFNFCATPSQYWLFYHWQHTTIWVLYWALLLREYTVRKYLKSENLYTEKYCCSVFVLLRKYYTCKRYSKQGPVNTIDLHLFYCVQNGKDSDTKIFIAVIFPHYMYIL